MPELIATAKVEIVVEVEVGSWGKDCTFSQLERQASEEALNKVKRVLGVDNSIRVLKLARVNALLVK